MAAKSPGVLDNRGWRGVLCGFVQSIRGLRIRFLLKLYTIYYCGFALYGCPTLESNDVHGLRSLGRVFHRELDALTLVQIPVSFTTDSGIVNKDIFFFSFGADKTKPLDAAKPLNSSYDTTVVIHYFHSSLQIYFWLRHHLFALSVHPPEVVLLDA